MPRPKVFRDPVHLQIRYGSVDLGAAIPDPAAADARLSWLMRRLIDSKELQRLRHIRQNGLTNLVFHGAEHSRFTHSMGVAHLAGEMYDRIVRNAGEIPDPGSGSRRAWPRCSMTWGMAPSPTRWKRS